MEYWIVNTDHNLWKVIQNGNNTKSLKRDSKGGIIILPPVSFEEHVAVQRETKARTLLLQSLPEDHMDDFHHLDDATKIWLAVKARFGGNEESKKMRKTMLKQEFSEFRVSEEEGLHKGYDRFQKILSQLNQMQAKPDNDDANPKFLRALSPSWVDQAMVQESFVAENEPIQQLVYEDFKQVDQIDMEELDIKWQVAMLSLWINKFQKKAGRKINFNNKDSIRFDRIKARCYNYFAVPAGNVVGGVNPAAAEFSMMGISPKEWEVKFVESLARTKLSLGFKEYIRSDEVCDLSTPSVFGLEPDNREVKSLYERFVKAGNMHDVPPPITGTFMPTSYQSDLAETQATFVSKSNTLSIPNFESNDFVSCDNSDKSSASETYDFASCVSSPKANDSFSTVNVKILPKSDVKDPSPTNDNFSSVVLKATSVPAGSRNSSASTTADRSIPAASRNRPASIHAGRHIPAGRSNKPAPFLAGQTIPTGWINHAARPFFRPTNLYFDNVYWPGKS
uniref:Xylulose kinase-1 n=1 Tax=Tanacetum cinerariifolium TaxID=118510 RepID=A0A699JGX9_TANCI|nr:xylulose kinase-1 [Tanacetum cinerariifolium]